MSDHLTVSSLFSREPRGARKLYRRSEKSQRAFDRQVSDRLAQQKRNVPPALFSIDEHGDLTRKVLILHRRGDRDALAAHAVLFHTVRSNTAGMVGVAPTPEKAALLSNVLRRRGVDGFGIGLERLDAIAERPRPAGQGVQFLLPELHAVLSRLDAAADAGSDAAACAAAHLRTASMDRCSAIVSFTADAAAAHIDVLHDADACRRATLAVERIAATAAA